MLDTRNVDGPTSQVEREHARNAMAVAVDRLGRQEAEARYYQADQVLAAQRGAEGRASVHLADVMRSALDPSTVLDRTTSRAAVFGPDWSAADALEALHTALGEAMRDAVGRDRLEVLHLARTGVGLALDAALEIRGRMAWEIPTTAAGHYVEALALEVTAGAFSGEADTLASTRLERALETMALDLVPVAERLVALRVACRVLVEVTWPVLDHREATLEREAATR